MKHTNELMLMIAKFLYGDYAAEAFSFDFPTALSDSYDALQQENPELCDVLESDMPEICAAFDLHGTEEPGTLTEQAFRAQVLTVYQAALPLSMRPAS